MVIELLEARVLFSAAPQVLFIRGAVRSGGFLEGTNAATRTAQLADIADTSTAADNSGWGTFAQTLRDHGYAVSEMIEGKEAGATQTFVNGKPIPFAQLDLSQYAAIVFGSNNARYDLADRQAIQQYINAGGGALFITDANFGSNWRDAADSDQLFLAPYGVIVNQDNAAAVATQSGADFVDPTHPLLNGVNSFTAEGVSSFTVPATPPAGVTVERVVAASGQVRNNDGIDAGAHYEGSLRAATARDADLVAITAGAGRVVAFGDRNSFFNANGLGTDITQADNQRLATNIFNWLTDHTPPAITGVRVTIGAPTVVQFTFNDNLAGSLTRGDILLRNADTGDAIPSSKWSYALSETDTQSVLEIHIKAAAVSNGLFQLQINKHKISDDAGNVNRVRLRSDFTLSRPPMVQSLPVRPATDFVDVQSTIQRDDLFAQLSILE